jgi:hypothetical protein
MGLINSYRKFVGISKGLLLVVDITESYLVTESRLLVVLLTP